MHFCFIHKFETSGASHRCHGEWRNELVVSSLKSFRNEHGWWFGNSEGYILSTFRPPCFGSNWLCFRNERKFSTTNTNKYYRDIKSYHFQGLIVFLLFNVQHVNGTNTSNVTSTWLEKRVNQIYLIIISTWYMSKNNISITTI